MTCPDCQKQMYGVEYYYGHPERYDGISEWECETCNIRIGRWSKKRLGDGEYEKRYGG